MMRLLIVLVICAVPPSTRPAKLQPAELEALHVQAYELMLKNDFARAKTPLEKVYQATPAPARNRALVLNHAILDATQKTLVMRALKDLTEYLTRNREPDEHATNILAGTLNIAVAVQPRLKQGNLWQEAFREWERRNYVLDHSRKGWRRWGTRWIDDAEHARIQGEIQALKQAIADQIEITDRAYDRLWSANQQLVNAQNAVSEKQYLIEYMQWYKKTYDIGDPGARFRSKDKYDPNFNQPGPGSVFYDAVAAATEARRLGGEVAVAMNEFDRENRKLAKLQNTAIRPDWPTTFEPVDPSGPEAQKPIDKGPAPTTAPAAEPPSNVPGKPMPPSPRTKLYN